MDLQTLNADLFRALTGQKLEGQRVRSLTLTLQPAELPRLIVERYLESADQLQTAVEMLQLTPQADGSTALQPAELEPAYLVAGKIERLKLEPGDVVVLRVPGRVADETAKRLREHLANVLPQHQALVLDGGMSIGAVGRQMACAFDGRDPAFAEFGPLVG